MMFRRTPFPHGQSPYVDEKPVDYITTSDGKRLPIDHTIDMAIEQAAVGDTPVARGLAKALVAALLALKDAQDEITKLKTGRDT